MAEDDQQPVEIYFSRSRYPTNMPPNRWFGFSRSYQDGRVGFEGRSCWVLIMFVFERSPPVNWYSDLPLSDWQRIELIERSDDSK